MRTDTMPVQMPGAVNPPRVLSWGVLCAIILTATNATAQGYQNNSERCQNLERQLVSEWQRGNNPQDAVVGIEQQLEQLRREQKKLEIEAQRRECYEEFFIFGRSLRRTRACIQLDGDIERMRRDIANLRQQRESLTNNQRRRLRREDLVAELARNGCGENYQREYNARRRSNSFFSLWEDEDSSYDRGYANAPSDQTALPFASYRTMCVRLCDGYYFPISFSTLGSRFGEDEAKCRDQCAAPAELYVYKNPGEDVEQMVSLSGEPYNNLQNAWRHRKIYIKGCSCKPEEYSVHEIELSEQGLQKQASNSRSKPRDSSAPNAAAQNPGGDLNTAGQPALRNERPAQ